MPLSEIFSKSFEDFKKNFKLVLKGSLLLHLAPHLIFVMILFILGLLFSGSISNQIIGLYEGISDSTVEPQFLEMWNFILEAFVVLLPILIIGFFLGIIVWILSLFLNLVIYYAGLKNDGKMSLSFALKNSKGYFWKFLGFNLLMLLIFLMFMLFASLPIILTILLWESVPLFIGILLILLCVAVVILLLILGVYLSVCWLFSLYIIMNENTGIFDSMRRSRELVKGRWWLTFGYNLLLGLIVGTIGYLLSVFSSLIQSLMQFLILTEDVKMIVIAYSVNYAIGFIFDFILLVTLTAFSVFFIKNIYLEFIGKNKPELKKQIEMNIGNKKKIIKKKVR